MSESQFDIDNRDFRSLEAHSCGDDEQASVSGRGCGPADTVTWQLDLNEQNLYSFKTTVQSGNVPLRTDFVDSRDYAARAAETHSATGPTGFSLRSHGVPTEVKSSSVFFEEKYDHWMKSHDSAPTLVSENDAESAREENNPLNVINLKQHVRILSSGKPAILRPENICEMQKAQGGMHYTNSLLVEPPSDSSAHEGSRGFCGYSSLFPEADQWSTQSVGDRGISDFISESNFRSLSKENLLHLKRELESDSIPLRPELLAGLENAVRAITGPASDAPSLFVACSQHAAQEMALDPDQTLEGKQDLMDQGATGMSFHSSVVEAPRTETLGRADDHGSLRGSLRNSENSENMNPVDHNSNEALPEEDAKSDLEDSREGGYYSSSLTDNEVGLDTSEDKPHDTKELAEVNSRFVREMQESTIASISNLCVKLETLEESITKIVDSQRAVLDALQQSGSRATAIPLTIRLPNKKEFLLPFDHSTTVGEVKRVAVKRLQFISELESGFAVEKARVQLDGKHLFEEDSLRALSIQPGATMDLCIS